MALNKPGSVEECVYFTNRTIGSGRAMAWVLRKTCQKCKKEIMGKPMKKNGKIDKKADHYVCYSCGYQESNEQVEKGLMLSIEYTCPHCGFEGETTSEYKRKVFEGVPSYMFECQKCGKKIGLAKKMKESKKKGADSSDDDA